MKRDTGSFVLGMLIGLMSLVFILIMLGGA